MVRRKPRFRPIHFYYLPIFLVILLSFQSMVFEQWLQCLCYPSTSYKTHISVLGVPETFTLTGYQHCKGTFHRAHGSPYNNGLPHFLQPRFKYILFTHRVSTCKRYFRFYKMTQKKRLKQYVKNVYSIAAQNLPLANSAARRDRGTGWHLLVKVLGDYVT